MKKEPSKPHIKKNMEKPHNEKNEPSNKANLAVDEDLAFSGVFTPKPISPGFQGFGIESSLAKKSTSPNSASPVRFGSIPAKGETSPTVFGGSFRHRPTLPESDSSSESDEINDDEDDSE